MWLESWRELSVALTTFFSSHGGGGDGKTQETTETGAGKQTPVDTDVGCGVVNHALTVSGTVPCEVMERKPGNDGRTAKAKVSCVCFCQGMEQLQAATRRRAGPRLSGGC